MSVSIATVGFDSLDDALLAQKSGRCRVCSGELKVQAEGGRYWPRCLHAGHLGLTIDFEPDAANPAQQRCKNCAKGER